MTMNTVPDISLDHTYHYPPELLEMSTEVIPCLFKSKRGVIDFFQGAGTPAPFLAEWRSKVLADRNSVRKHEIARDVIRRLNEGGDKTLAQRREVIKRISEIEDFSTCYDNDRYKAQGLVAQIRHVVNVKDSFTRMNIEREKERRQRHVWTGHNPRLGPRRLCLCAGSQGDQSDRTKCLGHDLPPRLVSIRRR